MARAAAARLPAVTAGGGGEACIHNREYTHTVYTHTVGHTQTHKQLPDPTNTATYARAHSPKSGIPTYIVRILFFY